MNIDRNIFGPRLFLGIMVFGFFLLAGSADCSAECGSVAVQPQPILANQTCPVCGMCPARYPEWQAQVIFRDGSGAAFDGCRDLFHFYLDPAAYAPGQSREEIASVLVHDFASGIWIDGRQAHFVVASGKLGPMGKEIIPFADEREAQRFISDHGGYLVRFAEVDAKALARLEANGRSGHAHHHGGREPIGVMGGHVHGAGDWMVSYRYMHMAMDGNRRGRDRLSSGAVLQDFPVAPLSMTMDMHMFGLMYAPTDALTLMAMVPYLDKEMDLLTRTGIHFTTASDGLGDVQISALYALLDSAGHKIHLNVGVGLPTGDIDQRDDTPAGPHQKLPYPMQLGSGTWDLMPGVTYSGQAGSWSWGGQLLATIRLGKNANDYTLGDRLNLAGWIGHQLGPSGNMTLRLDGQRWGKIDGADPDLNPLLVPTADPNRLGGTRLDLLAGFDYLFQEGSLAGHRFGIEGGIPIFQDLNGPQLETDWLLALGWELMW